MPPFLLSLLACFSALLAALVPASAPQPGPLVLAAASLQEAMTAAAERWEAQGHAPPVLSFAGTSALARQIESSAPADLFVSADEVWMDHVAERGLLRPGTRAPLLTNRLVLVAPASARQSVTLGPGLARALGEGRLAVADPEAVPAGRYGKQALVRIGAWPAVSSRIASAENVRAALALVARGEAPLGVVYETDARAQAGARVVARFPASSHSPISYPLAILKASKHPETEGFREFLLSDEGQAIFARYGFGTR